MTFDDIRTKLGSLEGRTYWRSLDELAGTPEFHDFLHREFPAQASEFTDPKGRRQFLQLMGASLALAGVSACTRQPDEKILPYVRQPEEIIPGRPLFYATSMPHGGVAMPLLAENHMGRPTKMEGNPEHPAGLGGTDNFGQASVLGLYDPDRSKSFLFRGEVKTWGDFSSAVQNLAHAQKAIKGGTLRFLTEPISSPSLLDQIEQIQTDFPDAKWHQWDAVYGVTQGGAPAASPIFRFEKADVVVSLDADFLGFGPGILRYSRDFASRRKIGTPTDELNRLYVVEPVPTLTGAKAEHKLPMKARDVLAFASALASAVGAPGGGSFGLGRSRDMGRGHRRRPEGASREVHRHRRRPSAGGRAPARARDERRARQHGRDGDLRRVRHRHGGRRRAVNRGPRRRYEGRQGGRTRHPRRQPGLHRAGGPRLRGRAREGRDPRAPRPLQRRDRRAVPLARAGSALPRELGDARAFDGTVSMIQPLIAPLYDGRQGIELLALFNGQTGIAPVDLVKDYWSRAFSGKTRAKWSFADADGKSFKDAGAMWRRSLHDGFIRSAAAGVASAEVRSAGTDVRSAEVRSAGVRGAASASAVITSSPLPSAAPPNATGMEIVFRPDPNILDGRFSNNAWLQELPKPLSKVTWDNVAYIGPKMADKLGIAPTRTGNEDNDVLAVSYGGKTVNIPVWVLPGMAEDTVAVHFGYGRRKSGRVGNGLGVDAFPLRTSKAPWFDGGATVAKTGTTYPIAATQNHFLMEERNPVRVVEAEAYRNDPKAVAKLGAARPDPRLSLFPAKEYTGDKWGMSIDLNSCTGCGVCITACQSENNIAVVGKSQVMKTREMHWIRVDTYYEGDPEQPKTFHQPVPCQQCEDAPCELVCPVAATQHNDEGLNDMVYNRCVGTRYCSNNCPYKVRRFNFLLYTDYDTESLKSQRNPDVTPRSRGVIEKCTYCVQRISHARIDSKTEGREIRDGEIQTACQQACPSNAIVFGNLNDPKAKIVELVKQQRNYGLLEELGTRPRTTYLAVVRNPNPRLEKA